MRSPPTPLFERHFPCFHEQRKERCRRKLSYEREFDVRNATVFVRHAPIFRNPLEGALAQPVDEKNFLPLLSLTS